MDVLILSTCYSFSFNYCNRLVHYIIELAHPAPVPVPTYIYLLHLVVHLYTPNPVRDSMIFYPLSYVSFCVLTYYPNVFDFIFQAFDHDVTTYFTGQKKIKRCRIFRQGGRSIKVPLRHTT